MGRNFDGVDDVINFGSDASVDDIFAAAPNTGSISFYLKRGATGFNAIITKRPDSVASGWHIIIRGAGAGHKLKFGHGWSTLVGDWDSTTGFSSTTAINHLVVTYNGGSVTNDPLMYVNGVADTVVQVGVEPAVTINTDAANSLRAGESEEGINDMNGVLGWLCISPTIWTAAEVNRARWWGRPGGGLKVYHSLVTDKLANEGSATANGTATGTTVVPLAVPVVRPGSAMMGLGVGW